MGERGPTATGPPSLFQIARCAQNRLPREKPAPAPNSEPTAIALRSPYRLANVPRTPQRTPPAAQARPHSIHSLPHTPKKASLYRAIRSQPCPIQPHARLTSSPRLHHFSPPIRTNPAISPTLLKHPHIRATLAQARDRPRGPETLPPTRGKAPGIRKGVPCGCPVAVQIRLSEPCSVPLSSSATRSHSCVPAKRRRHYRFARDRGHPQLGGAQNVAETNRLPAFAGITVLGTSGNLTQARHHRHTS